LGSGILVEPLGFGSLSLSLDTLTAKRVPVLADAHISVADDYITDTLRIFPDSVTVYGPWQVLDTLRFVSTIPHHALRMHQSQSYRLRLLNPEPDLLTLSEEEITLRLTIDQVTEKAFSVPVIPIGLSDSVRCFPQTVEVTCRVVTSYYDVLGPASFRVVADFSELSNYRVQRIVPLKAVGLPPWVDRVNIRPSAVEYLLME
jgi:YbbR domain-containing protein